jgi:hypothetical protein
MRPGLPEVGNEFTTLCSTIAAGSRCEYANDGLAETHWASESHPVHKPARGRPRGR